MPEQYQKFANVFSLKAANTLPPYCKGMDYAIELELEANGKPKVPPYGPLYPITKDKLIVLKKFITELIEKNFI